MRTLAAGAGALWALALAWGHWRPDRALMFSILEWLSPAACAASMAALLGAAILCRAHIGGMVRALTRRQWAALLGILSAALLARLALVPATERVYYDEHTYLQIARGIADEGRGRVASYGVIEGDRYRCRIGSYPHWSLGWPTLLAGGLRLTGHSRTSAWTLNLLLSLATAVLVAWLGSALVPGRPVGLAAAAIYACLPANQIWSRTAASEVFAAFGAVLAVLCAVRFAETQDRRSGYLLAASLAVGVQTRNEMLLLLPACAALVGLVGGRRALREGLWPGALALVLLLPQALHLGVISRAYDPNLAPGSGFGLRYVAANIASVAQYLRGEWVALICVVLALVGASRKRIGKAALGLWLWALLSWLSPMIHFGGSYAFPGGERFVLAWLPPVALAAGAGLCALHYTLRRRCPPWLEAAVVSAAFLGVLWWTGGRAASEDRQTDVPRGDTAFLRSVLRLVPHDGIVVSADPPVIITEGRSAVFLPSVGCDPGLLAALAARYRDRLYFFLSPSSLPEQWPGGGECKRRLLAALPPELLAEERTPHGVRALYRLIRPA